MNQIIKQSGEWLTVKEAAGFWGVTANAMNKLIGRHKDLLGEGIIIADKRGVDSKITKKALTELRNIANVKSRKDTVSLGVKKQLVKRAMALERIERLEQDYLSLAENQKRLTQMTLPQIAAPLAPLSLRSQFRTEVNMTAKRLRIPHATIMGAVYSRMYYPPFSINLDTQAKNKDCAKIDILEDENLFPEAIQLVKELFPDSTLF